MAQLGEQQVQGCTLRISRLEADLAQRCDSLRHQQDTQATTLASLTSQLGQVQPSLSGDHNQPSGGPANSQLAASIAELQHSVDQMQSATATATANSAQQSKLQEMVAEMQSQIDLLQESVRHVSEHDRSLASLSGQVKELMLATAAVHDAREAHKQLGEKVASIDSQLSSLRVELAAVRSATSDAAKSDSVIEQLRKQVGQLKVQYDQLQMPNSSDAQVKSSLSQLDMDVSVLKTHMSELHSIAAEQAAVHSQLAHLATGVSELQAAAKAQVPHDSAAELRQDVTAIRVQLSQLQGTSHAAKDSWQQDMQGVKSELAQCSTVARSTEAACAQHATQLNQAELQLAHMQKELSAVTASLPQQVGRQASSPMCCFECNC